MRQAIFLLCLWSCSLLTGHAQEADEANYDESKIPPYTLPALLKTSGGQGGCVLQEVGRQPQCGQRQRHPQTDRNHIQP